VYEESAKRVDSAFATGPGIERHGLADISFRTEASCVTFQQSISYAKAAPTETMIARRVAFDEEAGG
jgi:hypothetical protein